MSTMIKQLEQLLERGKDSALLRYSLGSEYAKAQQWEKAIAQFGAALEHDPHYSAAWKLYAKSLAQAERFEEARQAYSQGILVAKEHGDLQAAKEMGVFLRRLERVSAGG